INSSYAQNFIIKAEGVAAPQGAKIYLHDKLLNQYTLLTQGAEYRFALSADNSTQGDNRFELTTKADDLAINKGLSVDMQPNPATEEVSISFTASKAAQTNIRLLDISGVSVYNKDL